MKLTRLKLRKLILKEFLKMPGTDLPSINIKDLMKGDTGFGPPPDIVDDFGGGGGGGSSCEDPDGGDGRFDDASYRTSEAFEDYLMVTGLDYGSYVSRLRAAGIPGLEDISGKYLMDFLSDELLFKIALALCKQEITDEMLPRAFNNPARFL
tara:strand:- start:35 stop:490 length:456 start_codon:yes stop_codon:yes gene_type:complete